jgi:acetyltransferase-like isoleucine patch superfamily enzyme
MTAELAELVRAFRDDLPAAGGPMRRAAGVLRARWLFRRCDLGERVRAWRSVYVVAQGQISLADRVQFWPGAIAQEVVCLRGAELSVGSDSKFDAGVSIHAVREIRIGERCLFGARVLVRDEENGRIAQVTIADDVRIGHGAIVCPGVAIGRGSVVGAGSVVRSDVPPRSLALGNPAAIRPLRDAAAP